MLGALRNAGILAFKAAVFIAFVASSSACIWLLGLLVGTGVVLLSSLPLAVLLTQFLFKKHRTERRLGALKVLERQCVPEKAQTCEAHPIREPKVAYRRGNRRECAAEWGGTQLGALIRSSPQSPQLPLS